MKIQARPDSPTCFPNTSATDSGDALSCQPDCVTSTQRIQAVFPESSLGRAVGEAAAPARELRCGRARPLRAVADVFAALGEKTELRGEAIERRGQFVQRGD